MEGGRVNGDILPTYNLYTNNPLLDAISYLLLQVMEGDVG